MPKPRDSFWKHNLFLNAETAAPIRFKEIEYVFLPFSFYHPNTDLATLDWLVQLALLAVCNILFFFFGGGGGLEILPILQGSAISIIAQPCSLSISVGNSNHFPRLHCSWLIPSPNTHILHSSDRSTVVSRTPTMGQSLIRKFTFIIEFNPHNPMWKYSSSHFISKEIVVQIYWATCQGSCNWQQ